MSDQTTLAALAGAADETGLAVAGGVPRADDADPQPDPADDESHDATLRMDDEQWLEHALGDLHSSAWTTPTVEL